MNEQNATHEPVLVQEVLERVGPQPGDVVVDLTVGFGGHARWFAEAIGSHGRLVGMDVDSDALSASAKRLSDIECRWELKQANFGTFESVLDEIGVEQVDVLFADLGVNSAQLGDASRGLSFRADGPLDMRLDDRLTTTASDLVNSLREQELSDLIYFNSQERFSRRIAKQICAARRDKRITRTSELARLVCTALNVDPNSRRSKIHPATRVFQAFRIAVNGELDALNALLDRAPHRLNPGGRMGVIAFHSLEDGAVKRDFRRRKNENVYELITKKPVIAGPGERDANPRSRSAKLRVAKRTDGPVAGIRSGSELN